MKLLLFFVLVILIGDCQQNTSLNNINKPAIRTTPTDSSKGNLKNLAFAVNKDLACGMPVSAGIEDTLTYNGKLYGFCSASCKGEFLKNPTAYLNPAKKTN
jgi:YHS domain-containing protein